MAKNFYATIVLLLFTGLTFAQSGGLKGVIKDKTSGESIPFANVVVLQDGVQKGGTTTDFDGNYTIKPLNAGTYTLKVTYVGYNPLEVPGIVVQSDKTTFFNPNLSSGIDLDVIEVYDYEVPLIQKDNNTTGGTVTAEEIKKLPTRSLNSIAAQTGGVYQADEGGAVNIMGSRSDATDYYIDGIKVRGSRNIPQSGVDQVSVFTGGVPAQYGDASGGIISITTKGPSSRYFGGVEVLSSQLTDPFNYNLFEASVSGPIYRMNKGETNERSVVGFFLSANYTHELDRIRRTYGLSRVDDETLDYLENNPLRPNPSGGYLPNAAFVKKENIFNPDFVENAQSSDFSLSGKVDFQPVKNVNITLGGNANYGTSNDFNYASSMFNYKNYQNRFEYNYRVFGRFTQKFGDALSQDESSSSVLKNAFYTIQLDYQVRVSKVQDENHKDDIFKYGYLGKYETKKEKTYETRSDTVDGRFVVNGQFQTGFRDTLVTYTPGGFNPIRENYTKQFYEFAGDDRDQYRTLSDIVAAQALRNGDNPNSVYSLYHNTGTLLSGYGFVDQNQFRLQGSFSADVSDHAISFGLEYEQRTDRSYGLAANGLWNLMRLQTNRHIQNLDLSNPMMQYDESGAPMDTIEYNRLNDGTQSNFDKNLRDKLNEMGVKVDGKAITATTFLDLDSYDPDIFDVNMFSAEELYNNGSSYVNYYGYDFQGNKTTQNISYFDYFDDPVNRPIGPNQPIYIAGYIQDNFTFRDLNFRLGLRVDRYDANTKVLKDQYSLYDVRTASEVADFGAHPDNIGDDYVVYVDNAINPTKIVGYRSDDVFFDRGGNELRDGTSIALASGNGFANPYLAATVTTDQNNNPVMDKKSFRDYEPQVAFQPRISFSFPISDEALFFANYDILTQRPSGGNLATPANYRSLELGAASSIANPNLRTQTTTNYQLGFKQRLTLRSALSFNVFYREFRDNIQIVALDYAYPRAYTTFGNVDFGTAKGLIVSYDMRQTGNTTLKVDYTLSFAEGTGSSSSSAGNITTRGLPNLRVPTPLDFDQRHRLVARLDYRYGEGKNYNGPEWARTVLENFGVNTIFNLGSGTPYSRQSNPIRYGDINPDVRLRRLDGQINQSRYPWQTRIDLRVDKDIALNKDDSRRPLALNVYVLVQNLLDARNIVNVYAYTGNASDDGYLTSAVGAQDVSGQLDPESYVTLYREKIDNPFNYTLPRFIRLGAALNF